MVAGPQELDGLTFAASSQCIVLIVGGIDWSVPVALSLSVLGRMQELQERRD